MLILFSWYILMVFLAPDFINKLEKVVWVEWMSEYFITLKDKVNQSLVVLPSPTDLQERYESSLSWMTDIKNNIIDGIGATKWAVDTVRITLSWAEDTYNRVEDAFHNAKDTLEGVSDSFSDLRWKIDTIEQATDTIKEKIG